MKLNDIDFNKFSDKELITICLKYKLIESHQLTQTTRKGLLSLIRGYLERKLKTYGQKDKDIKSVSVNRRMSISGNIQKNSINILVENGVVKTNELFIINDYAKMRVNLFYNILQDKIDGKLFFYKEDNIYLTTEIKGNIRDPSILVGGQPFITKDSEEPLEDIKKIINEGITNIFQKLLEEN